MQNKSNKVSLRAILIVIALGIWAIVLQNTGLIPTNQNVIVVNTVDTDADVSGTVSVDNTVDVNIDAINGYKTVTTGSGTHSVFPYGYTLPVESW